MLIVYIPVAESFSFVRITYETLVFALINMEFPRLNNFLHLHKDASSNLAYTSITHPRKAQARLLFKPGRL